MTFKKYKQFTAVLMVSVILFGSGSCKNKPAPEQKETVTAEKPGDLELSAEQMSAEQMRAVDIEIGTMEEKNLDAVVKASGQLAVPPQNRADVSVLSGGLIRKISVLEGQQVSKGQVLVTIENQELIKIQQDYLAAKNNFTYIQAEFERQQQLKDAGAGTGKSYQSAQATFLAERSRITAYESQLRQLGISPGKISNGNIVSAFPLVSPISGTVGQITANLGAYVQPGTAIMEVVDNSKIHCDLIVFEKDLMKVKAGQRVNFQLTNQENEKISGVISGVNKSFENESKGVIVHAVIENTSKQNLIPGMYVTALISIGEQLTPAVPVDAVVRSEGKEYIFTVTHETQQGIHFKRTEVITGVSELGYIQVKVLAPLSKEVKIVKKGAFYLLSKSAGNGEEE